MCLCEEGEWRKRRANRVKGIRGIAWVWGSKVRVRYREIAKQDFWLLQILEVILRNEGAWSNSLLLEIDHFEPWHILSLSTLESVFMTGTWWKAAGEPRSWVLPLGSTDSPWQHHCYANVANYIRSENLCTRFSSPPSLSCLLSSIVIVITVVILDKHPHRKWLALCARTQFEGAHRTG